VDEAALATALEADAACLFSDWAGALVCAVAACIAGEDLAAMRALPDTDGRPDRIVLQRGHVVDLDGGSLLQLIRLGGGRALEAGAVDRCDPEELEVVLRRPEVAAGLFVAAGEARAGLLGLAEFAWACRQAGRPCLTAILDGTPAPAVIDAGASLVVLDRTALGGPPCGIAAGEAVLLRAVRAQRQGVGRAFRPRPSDAAAFPDRPA
jgi:D-glucosaminate-6-phosphate ammonia-lyase